MIHTHRKDWSGAMESFEKAGTILEEAGNMEEFARVKFERGLMWKARDETGKAKEALEDALSMHEEMGMKIWVKKCHIALQEL